MVQEIAANIDHIHYELRFTLYVLRTTLHFLNRCLTSTQMAIKEGTPINIAAMIVTVVALMPVRNPNYRARLGHVKKYIPSSCLMGKGCKRNT